MADIDDKAIGSTFTIHEVKHICFAFHGNDLLLLQFEDDGNPCQYIVAHSIYPQNGDLCWLNGDYFPFSMYKDSAEALREAVLCLTNGGDSVALS